MADPTDSAVPRLAAELSSADPAARARAAEALAGAGEGAAAVAVPLLGACAVDDEAVREWVVAALEGLGAPPVSARAEIGRLAASPDPLTAYWALTLLGRLEADAAPEVGAIAARLGPPSPIEVRQRAAWALARIGPSAAAARDPLRAAAADSDPRLARLAAEALSAIGG